MKATRKDRRRETPSHRYRILGRAEMKLVWVNTVLYGMTALIFMWHDLVRVVDWLVG